MIEAYLTRLAPALTHYLFFSGFCFLSFSLTVPRPQESMFFCYLLYARSPPFAVGLVGFKQENEPKGLLTGYSSAQRTIDSHSPYLVDGQVIAELWADLELR